MCLYVEIILTVKQFQLSDCFDSLKCYDTTFISDIIPHFHESLKTHED